ncbi:MAG: 3'-5' exonuclease [Pseudomonadota bacterium]
MPRLHPPDKQALLALPPYPGIAPAAVCLPQSAADLALALADLGAQRHIGFDTESRPTFTKGQESSGPEVVQFATPSRAYVLQLRHPGCEALARAVLAQDGVVKVGFDLQQDLGQLRRRLGTEVAPLLDLTRVFHRMGYPRTLGIKSAVALVFGQRFVKSKRVTTSNWANPTLTPQQQLYAANDAWVALQVLQALQRQTPPPAGLL